LNKVSPPKIDLSAGEIGRVQSFYAASCQTCHGENMAGGAAPSLVNAGQRLFYDEFKSVVTVGRGQMPGFAHVDEETLKALYRYVGGNPRSFNSRRPEIDDTPPDGPVVASGGATIKPDEKRNAPMMDYPEDVDYRGERYTTDYGLDWPGVLTPPWSSILAYDLNNGTVKWQKPVGEDSLYVQGDQTKGAPNGTQRKGMVITSTGVVFSTAKGGKLYAFNADNGDLLWETTLSHETNAQPSMYTLNGKQFLVINATSPFTADSYDHSRKPGALPRGYVVYALPEDK
jgi:quinoprotein glucose dehydrogenase